MLILIMMLAMEEALREMLAEEVNEQGLPPGFRFHPTDEELITFYLASKVLNGGICGVEIAEVDLNRCEPWELPDTAKMGEKEWYFFNLRDRKYPTGLRTNRATEAGYWKATGKDREVFSAATGALLGMKKTLVFYRGRAPRGEKTKWVMHEYRLDGNFSCRHACKEEWVICRIFHKAAGEKIKNQFFRAHSYLLEASVSNSTSLHRVLETSPALLESQTPIQSLQNPFFINQESNLKTLINPVGLQSRMFPLSHVEHSFSSTITNATGTDKNTITNYPSPSILYNSLLSHQDYTLIESTAPKQCKTLANFSHFQPFDANSHNWMDKIHQNPCQAQAPLFWEMDCGGENMMGFSAVTDRVHEISSSIAFNQAGFQMMLDPAIRGPGESGPLDV